MLCQRSVLERNVNLKAVLTTHKHWYGSAPVHGVYPSHCFQCHSSCDLLPWYMVEHELNKHGRECSVMSTYCAEPHIQAHFFLACTLAWVPLRSMIATTVEAITLILAATFYLPSLGKRDLP